MIDITTITPENIPLEFVKSYLRIDEDFEEDDVELMIDIKSAQSYVRNYLKLEPNEQMSFELLMPILAMIAYFYENKSPLSKSTEKLDSLFSSMLNLHRDVIL